MGDPRGGSNPPFGTIKLKERRGKGASPLVVSTQHNKDNRLSLAKLVSMPGSRNWIFEFLISSFDTSIPTVKQVFL